MSSRRLVFRLAALFLGAGIHTGVWVMACLRLSDGYRESLAVIAEQGVEGRSDTLHWGGWPFAAEVVLGNVRVHGAREAFPPEFDWTADRLRLRLSAWHPATLQVLPEGRQTIAAAGLPRVPFGAGLLRVAIDLTGREPVLVTARALEVALPAGPLRLAEGSLAWPPGALVARLGGLAVPGGATPIQSLESRLTIAPPWTFAPTPAEAARAWRQRGGHLSVSDARLQWDTLSASLTGSGRLDPALQPDGDGELTTTGLSDFLTHLAEIGAIPVSSAMAAKAVLAILAAPSGAAPLTLPVGIHGGIVSVARFPLLRLAPVVWP